MTPLEYYEKIKEDYDKISPSMCVLKWEHLEMHLGSAQSHSCFHVPMKHINEDEDFHNTEQKKEVRNQMLDGVRPSECSYCWKAEDAGSWSPRITLAPIHTLKDKDIIVKTASLPRNADVYPKYLVMSFNTKCQLKCSYCGTQSSSSWYEEIKNDGPWDVISDESSRGYNLNGRETLYTGDDNAMTKKFWEWIKQAVMHLHTIRLTGGEPLLSENTFKLAKFIRNHPNGENIEFNVNSNLCVSDRRVERIIDTMKDMKKPKVYASIDSWGPQAEYIRHGLKVDMFERNLEKLVDAKIDVGIMSTFNFMSIPNYKELLDVILDFKGLSWIKGDATFLLDTPHMVYPKHLSALIIDDKQLDNLRELVYYMSTHVDDNDVTKFNSGEYAKFERVLQWVEKNRFTGNELIKHRKDFRAFVDEHDKRRGTNFIETFPELEYFYEMCNG